MQPEDAEYLEIDEVNEGHVARHGVRPVELLDVFMSYPLWARNARGKTAAYRMVGRTNGGRAIIAYVELNSINRSARPITARQCTPAEIAKWNI